MFHKFRLVFSLSLFMTACASAVSPTAPLPSASSSSTPRMSQPATPLTSSTLPSVPVSSPLPLPTIPIASLTPTATQDPEISLLFTGQYVPGRCVQAGVDARGNADYILAAVEDLIKDADLAVGTVNGTISEVSPKTGCVVTFVLAGGPEHAESMAQAGFDAVSVATNHIKNCGFTACGDQAFLETLENLARAGVVPIGAGESLEKALKPKVFTIRGIRFGIVSLGEIEPLAFAGENSPGIAVLSDENLRNAISAARTVSDVVIVMPHWGPEYSAVPNWNQRRYAEIAVEAGADLVVGNHPHVVQAVKEFQGVPVFFGLGNFVFDQTWSLETTQSVILEVQFQGPELVSYRLIPVSAAQDGEVQLLDGRQAEEVFKRIDEASQALP